jgi:hypothetical protein
MQIQARVFKTNPVFQALQKRLTVNGSLCWILSNRWFIGNAVRPIMELHSPGDDRYQRSFSVSVPGVLGGH